MAYRLNGRHAPCVPDRLAAAQGHGQQCKERGAGKNQRVEGNLCRKGGVPRIACGGPHRHRHNTEAGERPKGEPEGDGGCERQRLSAHNAGNLPLLCAERLEQAIKADILRDGEVEHVGNQQIAAQGDECSQKRHAEHHRENGAAAALFRPAEKALPLAGHYIRHEAWHNICFLSRLDGEQGRAALLHRQAMRLAVGLREQRRAV